MTLINENATARPTPAGGVCYHGRDKMSETIALVEIARAGRNAPFIEKPSIHGGFVSVKRNQKRLAKRKTI
jgi:hypothetical protein